MVSTQKLISLFGKTLKDRQGNPYKIVSIVPDSTTGRVEKIIVENSAGMRSRRLANGRVRSDDISPRDILLTGATRQRRATVNPFLEDFEDEVDEEVFFGSQRGKGRARFGSFVTPDLNFDDDDEEFDVEGITRGPNFSSKRNSNGDLEITIKVKRN